MADVENTVPEGQDQQPEAVGDTVSGEPVAAPETEEAPMNADGQTQELQEEPQSNDVDCNNQPEGGDTADAPIAACDGDAAAGDDGGNQQEERQPTPAVVEEQGQQEEAQPEERPASAAAAEEPEPEKEQEEEQEEEQEAPEEPEEPAVQLSEEQMKRCQHYFDRKAVDGRLDLRGFKALCRLMGEVLSAEDADRMFEDGDRNDDGTIDFEEYCRLYCKHSEEENSRKAAMVSSIDKLFPSSDGKPVQLKKVKSLLLKMQKPDLGMRLVREKSDLNAGDIHRLVDSMDRDGNGLVSKQEFVDTLCKHLEHAV